MKVIVLTSGEYSDYGISGTFSTEEKAREYVRLMGKGKEEGEFNYEEYELDGPLAETWQPVFFCRFDVDGNLESERVQDADLRPPRWSEVANFNRSSTGVYARSVVSAEHARKLCAEMRQSWLREVPDAKFYWWASAEGDGPVEIEKHWYGNPGCGCEAPDPERGKPFINRRLNGQVRYSARSMESPEDAISKVEGLRGKP